MASKGVPQEGFDMQWKIAFNSALQKHSVADRPTYTTEEKSKGKWVSVMAFQDSSYASAQQASKKAAEQDAAKKALEALYPAEFQKLMVGSSFQEMMGMKENGQRGKKRKVEAESEADVKSKLTRSLQIYISDKHQRLLNKEDITYEVQEIEGEKKTYVASVTIPAYEGGKAYSGEEKDSKKEAELSAAQIAYDAMSGVLGPMEEEHKEKKKQKQAASLEALKKRTEEKKAAKMATGLEPGIP
eukprot:gnl/MRDRNA2_/MRDRNA2_92951_c0_seq1.p1 gnl/MRDRNA2_/MRDRNA2_92951_c0~~gnl/MRDRNA2_/MRDRNA2_92951_c0_seq1.p1  ORF type:complete len:277 (-),score=99.16 gnl/MRDRNA2_/MRDRNA2_92951_c0_seq1:77-805(-)